ncbi:restriction endonuclease [Aliidiomarina sanyensis]|uniref:Endonuclease n=1 Tax=Aliidiomarina sanyensis TaxID=1249555 RepID=A0A432WKI6_9GAMM|nr:restriction endonuclease [Aliidiomarina sanyensis]RUO34284.1 endonuclease [Aliidiomarina sanyensis]
MARKTTADALFEIAKTLPWWLSLSLAAVFFFGAPIIIDTLWPVQPSTTENATAYIFYFSLLMVVQYIFPFALVMGCIASLLEKARASRLLKNVRVRGQVGTMARSSAFNPVTWRDFERIAAAYFREQGFRVYETKSGPDGGIDLELYKDSELYVVQCKHWKTQQVPVQKVRELYGVMAAMDAVGGFFVASGEFTKEALRFARDKNIILLNGDDILKRVDSEVQPQAAPSKHSILCPACNSEMVIRTATRGVNAGRQFYGCSRYPQCKGIVNITD